MRSKSRALQDVRRCSYVSNAVPVSSVCMAHAGVASVLKYGHPFPSPESCAGYAMPHVVLHLLQPNPFHPSPQVVFRTKYVLCPCHHSRLHQESPLAITFHDFLHLSPFVNRVFPLFMPPC